MQQKSWSEFSSSSSSSGEVSCNKECSEKGTIEERTGEGEECTKSSSDSIDDNKLLCSFKNCLSQKELIKPFFAENLSSIEALEKRYAQEGEAISSQNVLALVLFLNAFKYKHLSAPRADVEAH